ncbi:MAG: CotH kinase family protein [Kiritimatiellae bacterium]|nr:CotH kinase family protein [Kiritimatiellia bacterium]
MMTLKMLSSVLGATMAASLFATLRITEICPRPDKLDPNGKEAGWIELTNTSATETVNLKDFALIRWNRGKEDKKKNRRILCGRELGPGERTLVYTSEAYPNYWDGEKVAVFGPENDPNGEGYQKEVMVFPSKVNPKKFPNVALYRLKDGEPKEILQTLIVPVDLPDNQSFGPGDAFNRIPVVNDASEYTYQLDGGEKQTGAGRLTVSTTQLPSDVAGLVTLEPAVDSAVTVLTDYTGSKDGDGIIQANAYDFSEMDAGKKGVKVTPATYPEGMYAVSLWFRSEPTDPENVTDNTTGRGMPLFECRPSKTGNKMGINMFLNDENQITIQPRNAAGTSSAQFLSNTDANYADNKWHHLVLVAGQKAGDALTLYIDGKAEITTEMPFDCTLQNSIPYCFGHAYDSTSWHIFKGQIADIKVFNRELTATDVAQLREENVASRNVTNQYDGLECRVNAVTAKYLTYNGTTDTYTFAVVGEGETDYASNKAYVENCNQVTDLLCTTGETLAFWVKPSSFDASGKEAVVLMDSRYGASDTEGYLFLYGIDSMKDSYQKLYIQRGSAQDFIFDVANTLTIGEWTHLALSIDDATDEATLYINGVKADTQTITNYTPCTGSQKARRFGGTHDATQGAEKLGYWRGFRGEMSEINIFSGVLPAREVAKLHNASDLATTKVTEAGTDESADVYESVDTLPTAVTGEMKVTLPEYAEGATLTFAAPETAGQLALTWNRKAITLDAPITLDGATAGTLTWTLTADEDASRMSVLIMAELAGKIAGETRVIMPEMTPGEANNYTTAIPYGPNIGPSNKEVFEDVGYYLPKPMATPSEEYTVVLDVHPIAGDPENAITKVELMYRCNFGETKYVPMTYTEEVFQRTVEEEDEAGETIEVKKKFPAYKGEIPATDIPANGLLIQFGARITDGAGRQWISPSRNNPDDCPNWYGTIVEPTADQTSLHEKLQTFHLFVEGSENLTLMDKDYDAISKAHPLGARCGIYDAQTDTYYDNVRIDLRGNTSAHFPKKSHGLRFSKCQPLTCKNMLEGKKGTKLKEIRKTSFTAEYADPTFIRQSLSFHMWRNAGNKVPFHYPVRLQLNGEFYQLAFHSNRFTDELIEDYYGLDPMGYGYKNVGTISTDVGTSAGSVEKKTPDDGDETSAAAYKPMVDWAKTFSTSQAVAEAELAAEANGTEVSEEIVAQREALQDAVYDSFDIPAWINYLAMARITQEADDIWANISLYWDKNGNDVWMPLAYDHNLSFGAWYFGDDRATGRIGLRPTADEFKSHPFYSGWKVRAHAKSGATVGSGNYAVEALWQNPEIRQMYLRRLRTLMDEHLKAPGTAQEETPFWDYVKLFKEVTAADAVLDRAKWGDDYTGTVIYVWDHKLEWDEAFTDLWENYVEPRRTHLYETHSITNTEWETGYASDKNAGIPATHPEAFAPILMEKVEGGIKLTNPNTDSIDLSGWTVEGMMDVSTLPEDSEDVFTLPPGTVLLGGNSLVLAYDRKKYVEDNDPCFVIGLAVYGDDKMWIPEPNAEATSIVLKKADGDVAVDNVLPAEIATWLNEAIANGKVTAEALAKVTAAADYELAYLLDEAPIADMAAATELDIAAFTIDAEGNVTLTATLTVDGKEKTGAITGQIKLYAKESLSDATWTEVAQEQDFGSEGEAQLTPRATKSSVVPRFFKAKIER